MNARVYKWIERSNLCCARQRRAGRGQTGRGSHHWCSRGHCTPCLRTVCREREDTISQKHFFLSFYSFFPFQDQSNDSVCSDMCVHVPAPLCVCAGGCCSLLLISDILLRQLRHLTLLHHHHLYLCVHTHPCLLVYMLIYVKAFCII